MKGGSKWSLVPAQGLALSLAITKPAVAAGAGGSICHPGASACERSREGVRGLAGCLIHFYTKIMLFAALRTSVFTVVTPEILAVF